MNKTPLDDLGEFGLIEYLTKNTRIHHHSTKVGVGDDAAVIDLGNEFQVITTDMLTEGIHFDLTYFPLKHLGYKAVAANISDLCAMNATAEHITVSIAVSAKFYAEDLHQLYEGIHTACKQFKVDLIGGDTTSSLTGMTISITAVGRVSKDKITLRSGAKVGHLLCVSGDLGASYMGLQLLEREKNVYLQGGQVQPDLEGSDYLLERFLKPEPRTDIVARLEELNIIPSAMIDVSDGLASEIGHLCKASAVGCELYQSKVPIDPAVMLKAEEFGIEPTVAALNGGEDYELLFAIHPDDYTKIGRLTEVKVIGHFTEPHEGINMVVGEQVVKLDAQGWNAFAK